MFLSTPKARYYTILAVRLLESRTSTASTELLALLAARVRDEERTVVCDQEILDLVFRLLIHKLLVEGHHRLRHCLANGVRAAHVSTTVDADANVQSREALLSQKQHRLEHLMAENLRLDELKRNTVQLEKTPSTLGERNLCRFC